MQIETYIAMIIVWYHVTCPLMGKSHDGKEYYAYSTGHFVLHDFLSTFMIIFFMLVDTLFTQCALKCKKCATQMMS